MAASPTQNPYNLPEGTQFTVLTARPLQEGEQLPPATTGAESCPVPTQIQFRSFSTGGTVLCLPMTTKRRRSKTPGKPSEASETAVDGEGEFVAFNEVPGRPMYKVSPESVAAFRRKSKRTQSRQSFMVG